MIFAVASQVCTIGGRPYRIASSSIDLALGTVARFRFVIEVDANSATPMPALGELVQIDQTANGVQSFSARVMTMTPERPGNFTRWAIDAEGVAGGAAHRRILNTYQPQQAGTLVTGAWGFYGPPGTFLTVDPASPPVVIEEYSSSYDSLMDLLNFAANSSGWAWESHGPEVRFFNPATQPRGAEISQDHFGRGSLKASSSLVSVFNVARQQAWEYTTAQFNDPIIPESIRRRANDTIKVVYCAARFQGPDNLAGLPFDHWEFVSGEVVSGTPASGEGSIPLADIEVGFSGDDLVVTTSAPLMAPPESLVGFARRIQINATFRRLVWTEARNQGGIDLYGLREGPVLPNDGGVDVPESLRRLEEYLLQRAHPPIDLSGEYLFSDIWPGEIRPIVLPDLVVARDFLITGVRRTFSKDGLQIDITARTIDESGVMARPKPEPMPEIFKRLERLEGSPLSPASAAGALWIEAGPIRGLMRFEGGMQWGGEFTIAPIDGGITLEGVM